MNYFSRKQKIVISTIASLFLSNTLYADLNVTINVGNYTTFIIDNNGSLSSQFTASKSTVMGFGNNLYNHLITGDTSNRFAPIEVNTSTATGFTYDLNLTQISSGRYFTFGLEKNGSLWGWGQNTSGELGDGTTTDKTSPVEVNTTSATGFAVYKNSSWIPTDLNITKVITASQKPSSYLYVTYALEANGTLWAWGNNYDGLIGDGTTTNSAIPVEVNTTNETGFAVYRNGSWNPAELNITDIETSGRHTLILEANGTLWSWGYNGYGQLGEGNFTNSRIPIEVNTTSATGFEVNGVSTDLNITAISVGNNHSLALEANGSVWAWGTKNNSVLGNSAYSNSSKPLPIEVNTTSATGFEVNQSNNWVSTDLNITAIASGYDFNMALEANGSVWTWGQGSSGQLGNGALNVSPYPVEVNLTTTKGWYYDANITKIFANSLGQHALAIDSNNTIIGWGLTDVGELGYYDGSDSKIENPIIVGANPRDVTVGTTKGVISWKPPFYNVDHYTVYRATSASGSYTTVSSSVDANATTYTDTTATNDVSDYYYIVGAHYTQFGTFTEANSTNTTIAGNSYGNGNWYLPDTTPNAFTFTDLTSQELSTSVTSSQIVVSGINQMATISISGEGCEYLISQSDDRRSLRG